MRLKTVFRETLEKWRNVLEKLTTLKRNAGRPCAMCEYTDESEMMTCEDCPTYDLCDAEKSIFGKLLGQLRHAQNNTWRIVKELAKRLKEIEDLED